MKVRLFGEVAIELPTGVVGAGPPLQRKMLALLALGAGTAHPLDRLIDDMWGEDPPRNAEGMVRNYAAGLRRIFEPTRPKGTPSSILETGHGGYRLVLDEEAVDVLRFERLVDAGLSRGDVSLLGRALDTWQGEPLADFPYDDFAMEVRDRLERRRLDALEEQFAARLRFDVGPPLVADLEDMVARHPSRERLWDLLMRAWYSIGDPSAALRAFDRHVATLAEWGLEPGRDLARLAGAIARRDDAAVVGHVEGNLPAPLDRFVGRSGDIDAVAVAIAANRLVTLVGAGGTGKTRLALEVARGLSTPVWLVDLAPLSDGSQVADAVVDALGIAQSALVEPLGLATRALADREAVLLLDNCEHLLSGAAEVAADLLAACPRLTVLATSREPLRVPGEVLREVSPLTLPRSATVGSVRESESGRLLVERARAVVHDGFTITPDNAVATSALLHRLEGMPLAIELVAVLLQTSPIADLESAIGRTTTDLPEVRRTGPARHRSLKAAVEWSYHLLGPDEQQAFRALGVMLGEFDLAAAEALGATPRIMHSLVSKSMVVRTRTGGYRLLIPLREFAVDMLTGLGEYHSTTALRNDHFERVSRRLSEGRRSYDREEQSRLFSEGRVHLVAAIDAFDIDEPPRSVGMVTRLAGFWVHLGLYTEGMRLAERAAAKAEDLDDRAGLHVAMAHMLNRGGDLRSAGRLAERTVEEADAAGLPRRAAAALNALGSTHAERGSLIRARSVLEQAVARYDEVRPGDRSIPLTNLAATLAWSGELAALEGVLAALRREVRVGRTAAAVRHVIDAVEGTAARMAGDLERAHRVLAQTLEAMGASTSTFHRSWVAVEHAIVLLEMGELAAADDLVRMALSQSSDVPVFNMLRGVRVRAAAALVRGDLVAAAELLAIGVEESLRSDAPGRLAEVIDTASQLAVGQGESEAAASLLATADEMRARLGVARDPQEMRSAHEIRDLLAGGHELRPVADPVPLLRELLTRDGRG